ncbi:MAG: DivIVA domain-containing protein [Candidatus Enterenecus sp.]
MTMMTPQEVASHAFAKATLGGYNMAMVDEFLDALTEDYTALYNDNAILKNKLKVLADKVEEYRATDDAMRKTLLAAQQMAASIVSEAEQKRASLVQDAEAAAAQRIAQLEQEVAAEEYRLKTAQEATAAYVEKLRAMHRQEAAMLDSLSQLVPPSAPAHEPAADIEADIEASLSDLIHPQEPEEKPQTPEPTPADEEDSDATRRFENLQFSKDYKIE